MVGIHDTLEVLACHGKAQESIERIREMRRGCEQEHRLLRSLLSDSYSCYRRITHVGAAMIGLVTVLGGFLGAALYHSERRFAEQVTESISIWWAG